VGSASKQAEGAVWVTLFAAVIAFAVWIRIENPGVAKRSPDEVYYMVYAQRVAGDPLGAPRVMTGEYNQFSKNWVYPIPLRIAYFYSIAAIMKLGRMDPERAGVALSTASSIAQLAAVALFGLRFFNRWTVLAALALLSVSFQDLTMARRVWGDGVSGCAAMILLWLCAEASVRQRAGAWFAAIWVWSAYFLLLKESGGFFFGFCVLGLAIESWRRHRSWRLVAWILAGAVGTAAYSFALMAYLCGGVSAALETTRHSAQSAPHNLYGAMFQSGPWYSLPLGLWVLGPLAAFCCAAGLAALIAPGNARSLDPRQRAIALGLGALIVLVITAATLPPALKNLRYISFIVGPWYLMAGLGLTYMVTRLRGILGPRAGRALNVAAVLLVLVSCWSDYSRFHELVVRRGMADLDVLEVVTLPFTKSS
jgi:hypothetical protein